MLFTAAAPVNVLLAIALIAVSSFALWTRYRLSVLTHLTLQESDERFQVTFEQAAVGISHVGLDGSWLRVNQKLCEITGYSRQALLKTTFQAITYPDDLEADLAYVKQMLAGDINTYAMEKRYVRSDQSLVWINLTVSLVRDSASQPKYFISVVEDISDRKRAEQALRDSRNRINRFIQSNLIGIVFADIDGRVQEANDEFLRIIGYSRGELEANRVRWDTVTPPEYSPVDRAGITEAQRNGSCTPYEKEYIRRDGHRVPVLLGYIVLGATSTDTIAFVLDITKRKQAEQALQAAKAELEQRVDARTAELAASNQALQDFAYVASHDLQEPLRKIQAFGDRLCAKYSVELDEQGQDYLHRMQSAAHRMQSLIRALLTYSRVNTQKQPFVVTDLNQIIRQVLSDLEARIEQTAGQIQVGELPTLEADPVQIRQLFQNLISNALKFHQPDKPPQISISQAAASADSVELHVQDNGIGFDPKYLDRIFAPFERLHGRSEYEGTGMGLAICRNIVKHHGGQLTAISSDGCGATFIATLPYTQPQQYESQSTAPSRPDFDGGGR